MDKIKIDRINELSRKSKAQGLTEEEKLEQKMLREQYISEFRNNMAMTLDGLVIMDEKGNKRKVSRKTSN